MSLQVQNGAVWRCTCNRRETGPLTFVMDVKFWQFYGFFRTVYPNFESEMRVLPKYFRTPAIMKIMEMKKKSESRRRAT